MKSEPSAPSRASKIAGVTINLKNVWGKPLGFVLLAFVIGATISQASFAFADDSATNPFRAIWDAIGELQTRTESLQSQINDLKTQQGTTAPVTQIAKTSDGSLAIEVAGGESGQTLVTFVARNSGPDNAVGTKLTAFYQPSLFQINFIQGADCTDGSRGIIECYLGTLATGSETRVTINATPVSLGQQAIISADLSSITRDTNPADNHAEAVFTTSTAPVVEQQQQPEIQQPGLTVQTDKTSYVLGEEVILSGKVDQPLEGVPVIIQVFNPNGAAYSFAQVNATSSGSYSYTLAIGGDLAPSGQYRILASYGSATAETTLLFTNEQPSASEQPVAEQQNSTQSEGSISQGSESTGEPGGTG